MGHTYGNHCLKALSLQYRCTISKICDALRDLVAFLQFKNREKHPWRSVNFSKA